VQCDDVVGARSGFINWRVLGMGMDCRDGVGVVPGAKGKSHVNWTSAHLMRCRAVQATCLPKQGTMCRQE